MKKFIFIIFSTMVHFYSFANSNSVDVIAVEYPPFTTGLSEGGGMAFDLLNQKTADKNIIWTPLFLPPARAAQNINDGNWCASFFPPRNINDTVQVIELSNENVVIGFARKIKQEPFRWNDLNELSGSSVAIIRSSTESPFYQQFSLSGITPINVETIEHGIQMLLFDRVDLAMVDNITFNQLEMEVSKNLQFSKTSILEMPITIFLNKECKRLSDVSL